MILLFKIINPVSTAVFILIIGCAVIWGAISNISLTRKSSINGKKQMDKYRSQFGIRESDKNLTWYVAGFGVCLVITYYLSYHGKELLNYLNGVI